MCFFHSANFVRSVFKPHIWVFEQNTSDSICQTSYQRYRQAYHRLLSSVAILFKRDGSASLGMWHVLTFSRITVGLLRRRCDRPVIGWGLADARVGRCNEYWWWCRPPLYRRNSELCVVPGLSTHWSSRLKPLTAITQLAIRPTSVIISCWLNWV